MRRFPDGALLSERLEAGILKTEEVSQLASTVADFHLNATRLDPSQLWGSPDLVARDAMDNFSDLERIVSGEVAATLCVLENWSGDYFTDHLADFTRRVANGFIRECHGDIHLANVIFLTARRSIRAVAVCRAFCALACKFLPARPGEKPRIHSS